jgi:hypothetical protein
MELYQHSPNTPSWCGFFKHRDVTLSLYPLLPHFRLRHPKTREFILCINPTPNTTETTSQYGKKMLYKILFAPVEGRPGLEVFATCAVVQLPFRRIPLSASITFYTCLSRCRRVYFSLARSTVTVLFLFFATRSGLWKLQYFSHSCIFVFIICLHIASDLMI